MQTLIRNIGYLLLNKLLSVRSKLKVLLVYHSIGCDIPQAVDQQTFKRQVQFLKEKFDEIVTVGNLINKSSDSKNLVAVTFDDGCRNVLEHAVPALEDENVNATFYFPTKYLGKKFELGGKKLPVMAPSEVSELSDLGHEIGSHSVSHRRLINLSSDEIQFELSRSKKTLEQITGTRVTSFAYPEGRYNESVIKYLKESSYRTAVTTEEMLYDQSRGAFQIPRVSINQQLNHTAFSVKTSSALPVLNQIKQVTEQFNHYEFF